MKQYKKDFIEFMVDAGVLKFGEFTTKSGRKTPYFINTGDYKSGKQIFKLGEFYSKTIENEIKEEKNVLFGPAYKGIPLVVTTSSSMFNLYNKDILYSFNRKEEKDHGEGGNIVGHIPQDNDNVLIVEDVVTAGTSVRESMELLSKVSKAKVSSLIISVDRMEKGKFGNSPIKEIEEEFGIKTYSIVTIKEIVDYLYGKEINGKVYIDDEIKLKIDEYLNEYGI